MSMDRIVGMKGVEYPVEKKEIKNPPQADSGNIQIMGQYGKFEDNPDNIDLPENPGNPDIQELNARSAETEEYDLVSWSGREGNSFEVNFEVNKNKNADDGTVEAGGDAGAATDGATGVVAADGQTESGTDIIAGENNNSNLGIKGSLNLINEKEEARDDGKEAKKITRNYGVNFNEDGTMSAEAGVKTSHTKTDKDGKTTQIEQGVSVEVKPDEARLDYNSNKKVDDRDVSNWEAFIGKSQNDVSIGFKAKFYFP